MLCEYEHAMGNSVGEIQKYVDAFYSNPRTFGGFIWDFIDQGLRRGDSEYFNYGGLWGDRPACLIPSFNTSSHALILNSLLKVLFIVNTSFFNYIIHSSMCPLLLYNFPLFSLRFSLFSKASPQLFQRRDKREEIKEKAAFLPLVEKHFYYKIVCIFFGTSTQHCEPI